MFPTRVILLSALMLFCGATAFAQRPGPQFWRKLAAANRWSHEPNWKRSKIDTAPSLSKVSHELPRSKFVACEIDAVEMREMGNVSRAKGIVISLRDERPPSENRNERPNDNRAFIDYEEIDPLLNAIDAVARVDETVTKLAGFEARYRTLGDLEIASLSSNADRHRRRNEHRHLRSRNPNTNPRRPLQSESDDPGSKNPARRDQITQDQSPRLCRRM